MNYIIGLAKDSIPLHQHARYEIVIYTKGSGTIIAEGVRYPVKPGNITIIPPGVAHKSDFEEEFEEIYIYGEFEQMFQLSAPVVIGTDLNSEGIQIAKMIFRNRYGNADYLAALCNAFAHFLAQRIEMDDDISIAVHDIMSEITNHFHDSNLNLKVLLEKSGYAEDYIRAQFKKITGKTPVEFLTKIRIRHACYLMDQYKSALSLAEIAEKCGYTDYIYFSRRFKQQMGVSPRAYKGVSSQVHT